PNCGTSTCLAEEFTCMASVGANGCGFEHQLESVYAALRNKQENAGFLRDDALLAVVFVTNEDDRSAAPNAQVYRQSRKPAMYGYWDTYRQTRFAVYCGMMPIPYGMATGVLMDCAAAPNPMVDVNLAFDISRYINFFKQPAVRGGVKTFGDKQVLL